VPSCLEYYSYSVMKRILFCFIMPETVPALLEAGGELYEIS
jgi:hypothetical protein